MVKINHLFLSGKYSLFGFSDICSQPNVPEDQRVLLSSSRTQEGAEEANVVVIDKIIQISEVTHEKTDTDNFTNEGKLDSLLNPVAESEQDIPAGEGINGHADSSHVQNGVLPCGPKAPEKPQEVQNSGQVTEHCQVTAFFTNLTCIDVLACGYISDFFKLLLTLFHFCWVARKFLFHVHYFLFQVLLQVYVLSCNTTPFNL